MPAYITWPAATRRRGRCPPAGADRAGGQELGRGLPGVVRRPRHPRAEVVKRVGHRLEHGVEVILAVAPQPHLAVVDDLIGAGGSRVHHLSLPSPSSYISERRVVPLPATCAAPAARGPVVDEFLPDPEPGPPYSR